MARPSGAGVVGLPVRRSLPLNGNDLPIAILLDSEWIQSGIPTTTCWCTDPVVCCPKGALCIKCP